LAVQLRSLILIILSLFVTSAFAGDEKAPNFTLGPDEGLIVIGIPAKASVTLASGKIDSGRFEPDGWGGDTIVLAPTTGSGHDSQFLVVKVKATPEGHGYAMSQFEANAKIDAYCGQKIPVLLVKPGRLQYYGMFTFILQRRIVDDKDRPMMSIQQRYDLSEARAYIKSTYPDLGDVGDGLLMPARFGKDC
jgi:hypothetical protein